MKQSYMPGGLKRPEREDNTHPI